KIQCAASVDDCPVIVFEPGKYSIRKFRRIPVSSCMRGGTHPVIEYTFRRRLVQIDGAAGEVPVFIRQSELFKPFIEWLCPFIVFMNYIDLFHMINTLP